MNATQTEINTQPDMWQRAIELLPSVAPKLPSAGERVAFVGCGTSFYVSQAAALRREALGLGESDALIASEGPWQRDYDRIVAITRSGATTEVIDALTEVGEDQRTLVIVGAPDTPVFDVADDAVLLDFADEESVVQTRFATTVLALLRAHFGEDLSPAIADARRAIDVPLPANVGDYDHFVFLSRGWSVGLAAEAALKFREAAGAWTESYAAREYRHGPISVAGQRTLVWFLDGSEPALVADIEATGAHVVTATGDPMAGWVAIHRAAVELALHRGMNPDTPRNLSRSVMLP